MREGRVGHIPFTEVGLADNCGLTLHLFTGDDTQLTRYNRPGTWVDQTGQHITPFRLHDFRGYEHENRTRPINISPNARPGRLLREGTAISVTSVAPPNPFTVSLVDFPHDLRLGVVIYGRIYTHNEGIFVGCASAANQTDNYVAVDLTDVDRLLLDVKFCLMDGHVPWTTTMPAGKVMYEIPREFPGENQNWINVPLDTPAENVRTFEIAGFISLQQVQYIIETYSTTTGRIDILDEDGLAMQINNIQLPANTHVSIIANGMPLQSGKSYTAQLYLANATTPVATRTMPVN